MPSSLQDDHINTIDKNDSKPPTIVFCATGISTRHSKTYKEFGGRKASQDFNSCPIIDDRSNSASPTRRQPNPAAAHSFRGFFGQSMGNEDRIVEWPPPEPRHYHSRPIVTNLTAVFGPRTTPLHNPNVWFFGPTATVQQLVIDEGSEITDDGEEPTPLSRVQIPGINQTNSDLSSGSGHEADGELSSDSIVNHRNMETLSLHVSTVAEVHEPRVDARENPTIGSSTTFTERQPDYDETYAATVPGVSVIPSLDEMQRTVHVQQRVLQPPPRQVFFVVMDTNHAGPRFDDNADYEQERIDWALQQFMLQLDSVSEFEETMG